jgi:hypothetical protein
MAGALPDRPEVGGNSETTDSHTSWPLSPARLSAATTIRLSVVVGMPAGVVSA